MSTRALLTSVVLLTWSSTASLAETEEIDSDQGAETVLVRYCIGCHGADEPKAGLRLDRLDRDLVRRTDAETWHEVLNQVSAGDIPPEGDPASVE